MNEETRNLINALGEDAEFRERFLEAPDLATRLELARDAGLDVPTEEQINAHLTEMGMINEETGEGLAPGYLAGVIRWVTFE